MVMVLLLSWLLGTTASEGGGRRWGGRGGIAAQRSREGVGERGERSGYIGRFPGLGEDGEHRGGDEVVEYLTLGLGDILRCAPEERRDGSSSRCDQISADPRRSSYSPGQTAGSRGFKGSQWGGLRGGERRRGSGMLLLANPFGDAGEAQGGRFDHLSIGAQRRLQLGHGLAKLGECF